jgi:hypothetical protein
MWLELPSFVFRLQQGFMKPQLLFLFFSPGHSPHDTLFSQATRLSLSTPIGYPLRLLALDTPFFPSPTNYRWTRIEARRRISNFILIHGPYANFWIYFHTDLNNLVLERAFGSFGV